MTGPPRSAFMVHCVACGYSWVGALLPLSVYVLAGLLRRLQCPACASGSDHIVAGASVPAARETHLVEIKTIGEGGG
jgi:hypothetical protein